MIETLTLDAPAGPAEAWLASPDDADDAVDPRSLPGVLFYVDAIGLRPQIASMIERIASWGYVVLAPHIFYRDGSAAELAPQVDLREPGAREEFIGGAMVRVRGLTPDLSEADAQVWTAALQEQAPGRAGVTGYCMGARLAIRAAGQSPDVYAAVGGFHGGRLATDTPDSPHLALATATAELVLLHADQDASMPPEQVEALGEAIDAAGLTAVNEILPGATHGYTMEDTSMYHAGAAEQHYAALRDLFARTLTD